MDVRFDAPLEPQEVERLERAFGEGQQSEENRLVQGALRVGSRYASLAGRNRFAAKSAKMDDATRVWPALSA